MTDTHDYPTTRLGVRDLDRPAASHGPAVNIGGGERAASVLGGAILAGAGVGRGGTVGWLLAAAGGALVYRGTTGHCSAYAAAGINTAR